MLCRRGLGPTMVSARLEPNRRASSADVANGIAGVIRLEERNVWKVREIGPNRRGY